MDSSSSTRLVVVVPAYNEEERIHEAVSALREAGREIAERGFRLEIFVVDDGSKDDTRSLALKAGADRVVRHRVNQGLGAAVRSGLAAARDAEADIAIKFDADLQHDPADLLPLIAPILDDEADVVYGNRFERIEYRMPFVRRTGNIVFTGLMRWLTKWPLRDSQPGIFAVSRVYLQRFFLPGDYNYTQQILIDAFHKGMRFAHVPVRFRKRTTGRSFVSFKYPFKVLPQIVMVIVGVRPMKVFAPIGLAFLALAGGVFVWQVGEFLLEMRDRPVENVNLVLGTGLFGLQTLFFGLLADLVVRLNRP
jgi:glycosyltransferase involved in cell wall biosynthesis